MSILAAVREAWCRITGSLRVGLEAQRDDDDLRAELESHLEMQIEENLRRGMTPTEARRTALVASGGLTQAVEAVRAQRSLPVIDGLARDGRQALRAIAARPGFAAAVVLTLALGIGANTAMFSVVNAVVLHPLPYPEPGRILSLSETDRNGSDMSVLDDHAYLAFGASTRSAELAAVSSDRGVLRTDEGTREVSGARVTWAYFRVLGVPPLLGRAFDFRDSSAAAEPGVVLSEQLWRQAFRADTAIIGRAVVLDDTPATVIGIMPRSFTTATGPQFWASLRVQAGPIPLQPGSPHVTFYYSVLARMRDGVTRQQLAAELRTILARNPDPRIGAAPREPIAPVVMTLAERRYGEQRRPVLLLFGAVTVLLLIACANLANLALVRVAARQREFAVRRAVGAGRAALARLLLSESLLLALSGAGLGLLIAVGLVKYFVHLSPASVGNPEAVQVDGSVLLFTLGVAVATAAAFGLAPAVLAGRGDLARVLSTGTPRASASSRQHLVRRALVVGQLATALVLLTGAGLVARSFWRATSVDLGFRPDGLLSAAVFLPQSRYPDASVASFFDELLRRVRQLPGVKSAAYGFSPLSGITGSYAYRDSAGHESPPIDEMVVGPGYFRTIGARMIEGHGFDATDARGPRVVVVNATLARRLYPAGAAVGRTMPGPGGVSTIVGVVADVRQRVEHTASPLVYPNDAQQGIGRYEDLLVRSDGSLDALEAAVTQVARSIDPRLPPPAFQRMDRIVDEQLAPRQFIFVLLGLFAGVAALLAAIGLYGVLSRVVTERTREIGIRVALGADPQRLLRGVLRQGAALAVLGTVLGLGASVAAVRVMRSLLFEISVYDPWTWAAGAALLMMVSLLASWLPARRATRVDAVVALRAE